MSPPSLKYEIRLNNTEISNIPYMSIEYITVLISESYLIPLYCL